MVSKAQGDRYRNSREVACKNEQGRRMRTLVVYYSRTGNTRRIGDELATALGADVEVLEETRERLGRLGYLRSGLDAGMRKASPLQPLHREPSAYELLVVGTPIWVSTVSAPVRAFLMTYCRPAHRVAWFCTYGLEGTKYPERGFRAMSQLTGHTPLVTLAVAERDVHEDHSEAITRFTAALMESGISCGEKKEERSR